MRGPIALPNFSGCILKHLDGATCAGWPTNGFATPLQRMWSVPYTSGIRKIISTDLILVDFMGFCSQDVVSSLELASLLEKNSIEEVPGDMLQSPSRECSKSDSFPGGSSSAGLDPRAQEKKCGVSLASTKPANNDS